MDNIEEQIRATLAGDFWSNSYVRLLDIPHSVTTNNVFVNIDDMVATATWLKNFTVKKNPLISATREHYHVVPDIDIYFLFTVHVWNAKLGTPPPKAKLMEPTICWLGRLITKLNSGVVQTVLASKLRIFQLA